MQILLTGATGYIGKRLLPILVQQGHTVICSVRDASRLNTEPYTDEQVKVVEIDLLEPVDTARLPYSIDVAYFLVHAMSSSEGDFETKEQVIARHFRAYAAAAGAQQVIYLSGISNHDHLSKHLRSRLKTEEVLKSKHYATTILRAGIIVGSGSASFEIIRDLVEKLPILIAPKWVRNAIHPIAIRDVIRFLTGVLLRKDTYDKVFDIGGPEVLQYRTMLLQYAKVRHLKRYIIDVPVMTPRLSSYWLYFMTSTSYPLAVNLVDSLKVPVVGRENDLAKRLGIPLTPYQTALERAFDRIEQNEVVSSWKDALIGSRAQNDFSRFIKVPTYGCFKDVQQVNIHDDITQVVNRIWSIGGTTGWYYATWLWRIRGIMDKLVGGIGLRRGRTNVSTIEHGDALDFWRVLLADRQHQRLLLYAEMKLPGEAWLEFKIDTEASPPKLIQTATFRPVGLWGRLYWWLVSPFHLFVFRGMAHRLANGSAARKESGKMKVER